MPRLVLWDVVLVLPEEPQIESIIYWVNAFNSELDFWKNQTTFLRDTLKYTVIQVRITFICLKYILFWGIVPVAGLNLLPITCYAYVQSYPQCT